GQRAEEGKRRGADQDDPRQFLKALLQLGDTRAHRNYTCMFWSLLRKGELAALTEEWIDWKAQTITVPGEHSKSGEREVIDLHRWSVARCGSSYAKSRAGPASRSSAGLISTKRTRPS